MKLNKTTIFLLSTFVIGDLCWLDDKCKVRLLFIDIFYVSLTLFSLTEYLKNNMFT